jgi:F0F1-type ATP synthase membrane subunit c/vacuolar-type H+-ATPase subunit K
MEKQTVEQHYRVLMVIWFVLLSSQMMFFLILYLSKPEVYSFDFSEPISGGENMILVTAFAILAVTNLVISFVMKNRCFEQAIEKQDAQYVRMGVILACAFCESISLMGLVLALIFSYQYFFLWFALGIIGIILHFPKRQPLIAADSKK